MTLTFPLTSAGPGPTSAALKLYIFSAGIAIPLRLMLIPVFHPGALGRWAHRHRQLSTFANSGRLYSTSTT